MDTPFFLEIILIEIPLFRFTTRTIFKSVEAVLVGCCLIDSRDVFYTCFPLQKRCQDNKTEWRKQLTHRKYLSVIYWLQLKGTDLHVLRPKIN